MQKSRFSICKISSIKMNAIRMNAIRTGMAAGFCFLLALAAGCSSDADLPPYPDGSNGDAGMNQPSEKDDEITTVPFTITLGGLSSSDANAGQGGGNTRVAPPGAGSSSSSGTEDNSYAETDKVNAVRLIAFRRRVQHNGENTATYDAAVNDIQGFEYDPTNDKVITEKPTVEDGKEDDYLSGKPHKHYVVKGTFGISRGYEYRIIALAYDSQEKSPYPQYVGNDVVTTKMLNLNKSTTFQEFKATFASYLVDDDGKTNTPNNWLGYLKKIYGLLGVASNLHNVECLSRQLITVPQLFYGTLYQQGDATQNPIISSADYQKENLGNNTPTPLVGTLYRGMAEVEVHITAAHYSKKLQTQWYCLLADNVLTQMPLTSYDGFKQGSDPINKYSTKGGTYTAIAYAPFPGEGKEVVLKAFVLPGKTHLAVRIGFNASPYALNSQVKAKDMMSSEAATGVIVVDGVSNLFYLRRNHKYVFTYTDQGKLTGDKNRLLD